MFLEAIIAIISSYSPRVEIQSPLQDQEKSVQASQITSPRSATRKLKHFLALPPSIEPMGCYVGELQERWQFPSDHMPIGMSMDGHHFLSWNVLEARLVYYITENNTLGLSRSMILDEHKYLEENPNLTVRDLHVIDLILETINHPTHPRSFLALQECSEDFLKELQSKLPDHFKVISSGSGEAFVVDLREFDILEEKVIGGLFSENTTRTIQEIILQDKKTQKKIRIFNGHLPGNPEGPARFEFASFMKETFDPSLATILMGDMNFNEIEMGQAFSQAFEGKSPFSIFSPYCTNISPRSFVSKAIDHFFVYDPESQVVLNTPEEVLSGLSVFVDMLQTPKEAVAY